MRPTAVLEAAIVVLALLLALIPVPPESVERRFSTGIYPAIQRAITPFSNLFPFALLDVLGLAVLVGLAIAVTRAARMGWRQQRLRMVLRAGGHVVAAVALAYVLFLTLWGFNYRRIPMTERLLVAPGAPASDAVAQLGFEAVSRLNALHARAHQEGWEGQEWRDEVLRQAFVRVQALLTDTPPAVPGRLKTTLLGPYLRWTSIDGMVNPFALEVLANPDLLPFERPFVAAHEWAHLAGYADESEASFVGWLTCLRADVPAQYSAWLFLYWQVNGEVDADGRARLRQALARGPRADLDAIAARLRRAQLPWLRAAGWAVYDQYLKANRVEAGVRSYSAVVTLILRARFADELTPVRRGASGVAP